MALPLPRPLSGEFWRRLLRRDAPESGPVLLHRKRIYVLPSANGLKLGVLLIAMLIGAINYNNSLGYLLVFLIGTLALLSAVHAFINLNGLRLRGGHPTGVFAGEPLHFPLSVENPGPRARSAVVLRQGDEPVNLDLEPGQGRWIELERVSERRGRLALGRITIETLYPLGLFRAWGYLNLDIQGLVYPRPADERGLPPQLFSDESGSGELGRGSDDFLGLRPYHPGDSPRHIHWKALAREQGVLSKQFGGEQSRRLNLEWDLLPGLDTEARLSRLCRWVLEADEAGLSYGLRLPKLSIPPAHGDRHRERCLEALALYGEEP